MLGKYDVRQANVTGRVWAVAEANFSILCKKNWEKISIFFLEQNI